MKYVKITMALFLITAVFATFNASAAVVAITDFTIPRSSNIATTGKHDKDNFSYQYATKTTCTDSVSGNEMAIQGNVYSVNYNRYSGWKSLPKGQSVQLTTDNSNSHPGTYKLNLKATNSFITTGRFYGAWHLD